MVVFVVESCSHLILHEMIGKELDGVCEEYLNVPCNIVL